LGFTRSNSLLILTNLIGGWSVYGMIGWTIYAAMMMALAVRPMKALFIMKCPKRLTASNGTIAFRNSVIAN